MNYVAIALIAIVLLIGSYSWGRDDGGKINEAAWQKRESDLNAKNAKAIEDNALKVRTEEHVKADIQNQIAQKALDDEKDRSAAERSALSRKLSIRAQCPPAGTVRVPSPPTRLAESDGGLRIELPADTAEALVSLASRCDRITDVARARKQILVNDRTH